MKRLKSFSYLLVLVLFWSCDSEDGLNCFQTSGDIIQQEFEVKNLRENIGSEPRSINSLTRTRSKGSRRNR